MNSLTRRSILTGSVALAASATPKPEQVYLFATAEHEIRMTLAYYDRYSARDFNFRERLADRPFCLSSTGEENRNCLTNFTGAVAVARYKIRSQAAESSLSVREYVRSIDASDSLPARQPFERVIQLQQGIASDIQVFGYQTPTGRDRETNEETLWCLLRQNLYLEDMVDPFLVLHWKHTLATIRVLDIIPGKGTMTVVSPAKRNR